MKKVIISGLFFLFLLSLTPQSVFCGSSIEVRTAAFFHTSKRFRNIYGDVGGSYQLEGATNIYNCIDGWANLDWSIQDGESIGFRNFTRVNITNLSLGIKIPYSLCERLTVYGGIGPSFSIIWLRNNSHFHHKHASKFAFGGVLKFGIIYCISTNVFLDLFADYLYQPVYFEKHVDIGGFKTGLGAGYKF